MELKVKSIIQLVLTLFIADLIRSQSGTIVDLDAVFDEKNNLSQQRVVGGYNVPENEYIPYQISMQYRTKNGRQQHFCGGSIISPNRILTAAHCVNGQNAEKMSVVAGIRDLKDTNGQRSQVLSYEMHENYEELVTSDIAILKIDPPLKFDDEKVNKINVLGSEKVDGDQSVVLTGWGALWHIGQGPFARYPNRLQKLSYKTITNESCKKTMTQLTDTEICAKERFGKGACNGDSGGPLVMESDEGVRQVGIVSYGTALCASNSPDVYTRVSVFEDWIKQRMA